MPLSFSTPKAPLTVSPRTQYIASAFDDDDSMACDEAVDLVTPMIVDEICGGDEAAAVPSASPGDIVAMVQARLCGCHAQCGRAVSAVSAL